MNTRPTFYETEIAQTNWIVPERYHSLKIVGHGAFGTVCFAWDETSNRKVAIKRLSKPFEGSEYGKRTYREMKILNHMDHENIICLIDAFSPQTTLQDFKDVYLVTPMMNADLAGIIRTQQLRDDHIQFLVYQILRALKYLHSAGLVHRDLKPQNLAVNEDCELKLLDFGLARQQQDEMTGYVATRWYRAPEVLLDWMHYNNLVDIWSVVCIMIEMKTRTPFFPGSNHIDQLKRIMKTVGTPDAILMQKISSDSARSFIRTFPAQQPEDFKVLFPWASPEVLDFLGRMLCLDPDRRSSATQLLSHPYMASFHDESDEPISEPYNDPIDQRSDITVQEWREHVWELLTSFTAKVTSLDIHPPAR